MNRQDECTGRFWEGRFKAQVLLDDAALLACVQYVDLNPIRAGIAKTPESSDFTSAQNRIADLKCALTQDNRIEHGDNAGWLAPVALDPPRKRTRAKPSKRRCSNKGLLPISLGDYLQLLDWTGRQIRSGRRSRIPKPLKFMLERLQISSNLWVECVQHFHKWFRSTVGRPKSMESAASARGQSRASSIRNSRQVFG